MHDTFVIAWTKVSCLRNPDRLRAWLFAMARHECHSRPRAGALSAPRTDIAGMTGDGNDAEAGDAEVQYLVRAALTGLEPAERELVELNLRCELEGADLADILGVSRSQAQTLAKRARSRFTKLLGLLLAAWPARGRCPGAAGLLDGWDGTLTTALSKRLAGHVRRCSVCGRMRPREIRPALMLALLPAAVPPDRLWERVADLVRDHSPDAEDRRQRIARRAEPLASTGFPVQATRPPAPRPPARYVVAAGAAAAAIALLGGGAFLVTYDSSHNGQPSATGAPVPTASSVPAKALRVVPPASSASARSSSPASYLAPSYYPATLAPTSKAPTGQAHTSPAPTKTPTSKAHTTPAPTKTARPTPTPTKTAPTTPAPSSTSPTTPASSTTTSA